MCFAEDWVSMCMSEIGQGFLDRHFSKLALWEASPCLKHVQEKWGLHDVYLQVFRLLCQESLLGSYLLRSVLIMSAACMQEGKPAMLSSMVDASTQ